MGVSLPIYSQHQCQNLFEQSFVYHLPQNHRGKWFPVAWLAYVDWPNNVRLKNAHWRLMLSERCVQMANEHPPMPFWSSALSSRHEASYPSCAIPPTQSTWLLVLKITFLLKVNQLLRLPEYFSLINWFWSLNFLSSSFCRLYLSSMNFWKGKSC